MKEIRNINHPKGRDTIPYIHVHISTFVYVELNEYNYVLLNIYLKDKF